MLVQCKAWEFHDLAALDSALVGADSDAGPVGARDRIGPRIAILNEGGSKFMDEVRV